MVKTAGFRSNESFRYGPPLAAALLPIPSGSSPITASQLMVAPTGFELVAQINKTKAPLYIWRAVAPAGYVSLGDLVSNSSAAPTTSAVTTRVVRSDCATACGPAFALWATSPKGEAALSIWGARPKPGSGDVSGAQFIATNISVTTEDAATSPPTLQCLAAACVAPAGMSPEQIHLALGVPSPGTSSMVIKWTTEVATPDSTCLCLLRSTLMKEGTVIFPVNWPKSSVNMGQGTASLTAPSAPTQSALLRPTYLPGIAANTCTQSSSLS